MAYQFQECIDVCIIYERVGQKHRLAVQRLQRYQKHKRIYGGHTGRPPPPRTDFFVFM